MIQYHDKSRNELGLQPFHVRDRCHKETSPLICCPNQWTGFYMIMTSVMKGLSFIIKQMCFILLFFFSEIHALFFKQDVIH